MAASLSCEPLACLGSPECNYEDISSFPLSFLCMLVALLAVQHSMAIPCQSASLSRVPLTGSSTQALCYTFAKVWRSCHFQVAFMLSFVLNILHCVQYSNLTFKAPSVMLTLIRSAHIDECYWRTLRHVMFK